MAVVDDVNLVTIAIDSSFLGSEIHYLLLILFLLIATVITYSSSHHELDFYLYVDNDNN